MDYLRWKGTTADSTAILGPYQVRVFWNEDRACWTVISDKDGQPTMGRSFSDREQAYRYAAILCGIPTNLRRT